VKRLFRSVAVAYLLVVILLYFNQGWLIFPGRATQGQAYAQVEPPPGTELVSLRTASGVRIVALFGKALGPDGSLLPDSAHRPTMLFFYGNGTWLSGAVPQFQKFRRLGANVLIPEYVGYGMSGGTAGEKGCYATADAAYDYLLTRKDVSAGKIVAAGGSLGGAVAIDLAFRKPVAGLATFSTFTSMGEMAARNYPFVPVKLLLRHRFESERKMARARCPVLIGHGTEDALVPYAMADRLAAAAPGPVTRLRVEGAGHNDFFSTGGNTVLEAFRRFMQGLHLED
jgi:fermentation-respiration switch protein FrsA (DUF1100 family)